MKTLPLLPQSGDRGLSLKQDITLSGNSPERVFCFCVRNQRQRVDPNKISLFFYIFPAHRMFFGNFLKISPKIIVRLTTIRETERRVMQTTHTEKKTYSYPITSIGLDDDVYAAIKRIAQEQRRPAYRLASDVLRKWIKRQEMKGGE